MKSRVSRIVFLTAVILGCSLSASSRVFDFHGQLSGWAAFSADQLSGSLIGLRYLPVFSLEMPISENRSFDAEFSVNAWGSAEVHALNEIRTDGTFRLYRAHARYSSPKFEARLGLQKISFGSALLLRPLMWFDRLDPRDPLQITDGVYGLLLRYYFLNNANIWLWGLYENDDPKGWEFFPTEKRRPEFGGRFQVPLGKGELAFSYHHRKASPETENGPSSTVIPENRYALDGKWDIGVGVWFEAVLTHQESQQLPYTWQKALNIGMDYTFNLGSGLHVLGEYFESVAGKNAWGDGEVARFAAIFLNYPVGLLDTLAAIVYYDWENRDTYSFFRWQRTYDRWTFHLMAFWNPERFQVYRTQPDNNLFAGKGIQAMVVFNH